VREERYCAAGVPKSTIYFLIRRGGAALVDRVVEKCGTDLRLACFFFGERLKGLRRSGVPVNDISAERWSEFFGLLAKRAVLGEAWQRLVTLMAAAPEKGIGQIVDEEGLTEGPSGWAKLVRDVVESYSPAHNVSHEGRSRFYMGRIMPGLRGRVPAREVARELRALTAGAGDRAI